MTTTDVTGVRSGGRVETTSKDKSSDSSAAAVEGPARAVSDSVQLSAAASQLAELKSELEAIDVVDMSKVEDIRQAIANGSYLIDTKKIAQSLLSLEGELV